MAGLVASPRPTAPAAVQQFSTGLVPPAGGAAVSQQRRRRAWRHCWEAHTLCHRGERGQRAEQLRAARMPGTATASSTAVLRAGMQAAGPGARVLQLYSADRCPARWLLPLAGRGTGLCGSARGPLLRGREAGRWGPCTSVRRCAADGNGQGRGNMCCGACHNRGGAALQRPRSRRPAPCAASHSAAAHAARHSPEPFPSCLQARRGTACAAQRALQWRPARGSGWQCPTSCSARCTRCWTSLGPRERAKNTTRHRACGWSLA